MVGQVQDGVGIGRDAVVHPQGVVLGEDVPHRNFQVAGEAVLARRALGLQQQGIAEGLDVVDLFGEGAVQMIPAVVGLQLVFPAAHAELRVLDAVGVPPHKGAAAGAAGRIEILFVVGKGIVAHHDIHRTLFCGDKDVFDHAAASPPGFDMMYSLTFSPSLVTPKGLERNCAIGLRLLFRNVWIPHSRLYPLLL